jgi:hypothetical protein
MLSFPPSHSFAGDGPFIVSLPQLRPGLCRCVVSRELGGQVLDLILSGKDKEEVVDGIHSLLTAFAADSRGGKVPLDKFVITKGLNKSPRDYPDAKGQPHLQVRSLACSHVHLSLHCTAALLLRRPHWSRVCSCTRAYVWPVFAPCAPVCVLTAVLLCVCVFVSLGTAGCHSNDGSWQDGERRRPHSVRYLHGGSGSDV